MAAPLLSECTAQTRRKGVVSRGRRLPLQRRTILVSWRAILLSPTPKSEKKNNYLLINPHDLGALEAKASHQTLLVEGEGVDAAMQCVGGKAAGHSLVHDDNAGTRTNLPPARIVYPVDRFLVHQEQGVTVFLHAGLQAVGRGYRPISAVRMAVHEKNSLAPLSAKDEPGFHYIRKNKDGRCVRFSFGGRRILRHKLLQSATGLAGQIVGGCRASGK